MHVDLDRFADLIKRERIDFKGWSGRFDSGKDGRITFGND